MKCPVDDGLMREMVITQEDEYRGVPLHFRATGMRCDSCDYETVAVAQAPEYNRAMADAYRAHEGLLTSGEIRAARERLDMSQQDFADYLSVGVASVKRWEWGQVQEKSLDKLMRVLTDPDEAERVARRVRNLVGSEAGKVTLVAPAFADAAKNLANVWTTHLQLPADRSLQDAWSAMLRQSTATGPSHFAGWYFANPGPLVEADGDTRVTPSGANTARALRLVA